MFSCCCLFCFYVFSPILYLVSLGEPMSPFGYYSITIFSGRPSWNFGFTEPTCCRFPSILYSTQYFLLLSFVQLSGLPMKGQDACEHILVCLYHHCVSSSLGALRECVKSDAFPHQKIKCVWEWKHKVKNIFLKSLTFKQFSKEAVPTLLRDTL